MTHAQTSTFPVPKSGPSAAAPRLTGAPRAFRDVTPGVQAMLTGLGIGDHWSRYARGLEVTDVEKLIDDARQLGLTGAALRDWVAGTIRAGAAPTIVTRDVPEPETNAQPADDHDDPGARKHARARLAAILQSKPWFRESTSVSAIDAAIEDVHTDEGRESWEVTAERDALDHRGNCELLHALLVDVTRLRIRGLTTAIAVEQLEERLTARIEALEEQVLGLVAENARLRSTTDGRTPASASVTEGAAA
jgi:hypothetical protein